MYAESKNKFIAANFLSVCTNCPRRGIGLCKVLVETLLSQSRPQMLSRIMLAPKQLLFRQNDLLHETYVLREGWIQLYRNTENGKRQVFRPILPGELFGLQAEIDAPSIYSAIALQPSLICVISDLENLCLLEPKLAIRLAWMGACDKILTEIYLAHINQRNAREKIAFLTFELFCRLKSRSLNHGYTIPFPLIQQDIADTVGLTTVHVNRTLHALKEEGKLMIHGHSLTILDYKALCALAKEDLNILTMCNIAADLCPSEQNKLAQRANR